MAFNTQQHIADMAIAEEVNRARRIAVASEAYYARYAPPLAIDRTKKTDDNAMPNFARVIVDKGAGFLFGKGVRLDINRGGDETTGLKDQSDDAWLDGCLKLNRFPAFLMNAATNGGISGHVFIKINGAKSGEKYPRLILLDSNAVTVTTDPEDITDVVRYKIQFNAIDPLDGGPIVRKQLIERGASGKWTITDSVSKGGNSFLITSVVEWIYLWPPIVDCQNMSAPNAYYGMSDLEPDILHLITRLHYVISNAGRINRFHAHPKTVGSGFSGSELRTGPDETIVLPHENSKLFVLEAHGDIAGSMQLYDKLHDALTMLARVPPVSLGKLETVGAVSGVALQILYGPLMEMTSAKRMLYGPMLETLGARLLEMGGFADRDVDVIWHDPMPKNGLEQSQVNEANLRMGIVSRETLAEETGYDWQKEQRRMDVGGTDAASALMKAMENRPPSAADTISLP